MSRNRINITAAELRNGDLLRLGSSDYYVLIADSKTVGNDIALSIYNGTTADAEPTLRFKRNKQVELSMRDAKP